MPHLPSICLSKRYWALATLWLVMEIGAGLAVLGLIIGNLPIAFTVLRQFSSHQRRHLWLVALPILSLCSLGICISIVPRFIYPNVAPLWHYMLGYGFWILLWGAIIISVVSVRKVITLSSIPACAFSFSLTGSFVAMVAMGFIIVAALFWLIVANRALGEAFNEQGFLNIRPVVTFDFGILCMLLALTITGQTVIKKRKVSTRWDDLSQ